MKQNLQISQTVKVIPLQAAEAIKPQVAIADIVTAGHLNPAPGGSQQKYEHLVQ